MGSHHSGSTASKNEPWLIRVELCKLGRLSSLTGMPRRGHLHKTSYNIGRPRHPTLQDGRQLLRLVSNGRTNSANTPQRRMAAAKKCTIVLLVDQKSVGSSKKHWTMSKEEAPADRKIIVKADYRCEGTNGSKWKECPFCNNTDRDLG